MERAEPSVVYLDTHIVVWLYAGLTNKLTKKAVSKIEASTLRVSQLVRLELQYLYEINRIKVTPAVILKSLSHSIALSISDCPLTQVIDISLETDWTRDVFDRLLTAEAAFANAGFITADRQIRENFEQAVW